MLGTIVSRMVPFQDGWGEEHKKCASADASDTIKAISWDQLSFYAEVIRGLSDEQWRVFQLHYGQKTSSTSEIARHLGFNQTGDVRTHIRRIEAKMARLHANLELIKIRLLPPDEDVDSNEEEDDDSSEKQALVSRHQLTRPQSDRKDKQPVCRALPPSCRNRKAGVK